VSLCCIEVADRFTQLRVILVRMELPSGLELVRSTGEFDETSVPAGLLSAHRIASGVWGRLVVRSGALVFVVEDDPSGASGTSTDVDERRTVVEGESVVIPPGLVHHVELTGPVAFRIEFHRSIES
jgi:tellurite resistance-related uncharacterized protein